MRPGFPERGSFGDKFSEIERRLQALESANRLTSASIGSGGLAVKGGGNITLEGGAITVESGGDITVDGGDFLVTTAGGTFALSPLSVLSEFDEQSGSFTITSTISTVLEIVFTIPDWVGQVVLVLAGTLIANNGNPSASEALQMVLVNANGHAEQGTATHSTDITVDEGRKATAATLATTITNPTATLTCRLNAGTGTQDLGGEKASLTGIAILTA